MNENDRKRIEREKDLFDATRGADYSQLEKSRRLAEIEFAKGTYLHRYYEQKKQQRWRSNGER